MQSLPKTKRLPLASLRIPTYQRQIDESKIKRIMSRFNINKVQTPLVNLRPDGFYYLVNGQHTTTCLMLSGYIDHDCIVIQVPVEEEALLYLTQHENVKQLSRNEKFRVRADQKNERDLRIIEIAKKTYWKIPGLPVSQDYNLDPNKDPIFLKTVTGLEESYDLYGPEVLERTLAFLHEGWSGYDDVMQPSFVRGMARFLSAYSDADIAPYKAGLIRHSPAVYISNGAGYGGQSRRAEGVSLALLRKCPGLTKRGIFRAKRKG